MCRAGKRFASEDDGARERREGGAQHGERLVVCGRVRAQAHGALARRGREAVVVQRRREERELVGLGGDDDDARAAKTVMKVMTK